MKVYLAAPYAFRDVLKKHVKIWQEHRHEVTCGWVQGSRPLEPGSFGISAVSSDDEVRHHAELDLSDVARADVLVHYSADYVKRLLPAPALGYDSLNLYSGGRHVETGYAIALSKPVIVIGEFENIFQRGLCHRAESLGWALSTVEQFSAVRLR